MKFLRYAVLSLPLMFMGCAETLNPSPQHQAADLLDEEIQQVQNQISTHAGNLPGDRQRWSATSIKVNEDLYNRLDDLFRQRQLLAKELGKQADYTPRPPTTTTTIIEQTSTPRMEARSMNNKDISRAMSKVLRHDPASIDLKLDEHGWADIIDLIYGLSRKFMLKKAISFDTIYEIVAECEKQRFALSEDKMRIRANQGHSIGVNLGLTPTKPPSGLWHGTGAKTVDVILSDGLKKMRRDHVHLSPDIETARKVGARHGKPVVFWVDVFQHQIETSEPYYLSENGVWLVDNVPAKYLRVFD